MQEQERRTHGIARVPVETVVELCGRDGDVPAFEAASIEVSGRGMHVKADYLPDVGAPLVLRFELGNEEITAEGEVAWKNPTPGGGEFGICFTALDSAGVLALKRLANGELAASTLPQRGAASKPRHPSFEIPEGAAVRLHLPGLGAPMKARVFRQGLHRLHVGSELEFLTVGRPLELQPTEGEERRTAEIDSVSVVIDPETQVPQLVVALRVAGASERTPDPSVVETSHPDLGDSRDGASGELGEAAFRDSMSDQLDAWVVRVGDWTKHCGEGLKQGSRHARGALAASFERLGGTRRSFGQRWGHFEAPRRRTTSPARAGSSQRFTLRRQGGDGAQGRHELGSEPQERRLGIPLTRRGSVIAAGLTLGGLVCWGMLGSQAEPPVVALQAARPNSDLPAPMAPLVPAAAGDPRVLPRSAPSGATALADAPLADHSLASQGLTPDGKKSSGAVVRSPTDLGDADDEVFSDRVPTSSATALTHEIGAWGKGRLHLPIVHQIRLDKPAASLEGVETATGFRVLLAGRKVLENGRAIEKRDDRITQVITKNDADGARIEFRFQKGIPPYKVRARNDVVEFFISAD